MKKLLLPLLILTLSGCSKEYFQLHNTEYKSPPKENEEISISYDFWGPGGRMAFTITNNTDQILTIHTEKCFFVLNGMSNCHYTGEMVSQSTVKAGASSVPNPWTSGTVSAMIGQSTTSSIQQQKTTRVAPRASHAFSAYTITESIVTQPELKINPKKTERPKVNYTYENSPVRFSNIITYSLEGDEKQKTIEHSFYVKSVSNYIKKDFLKPVEKWPNSISGKYYSPFAAALNYYIMYIR